MKRLAVIVIAALIPLHAGALYKNTASQKVCVKAWDTGNNTWKTGDAANITLYYDLDAAGTGTSLGNPTEIDGTNMPGLYCDDVGATETNADLVSIHGTSSTANIEIAGADYYTIPSGVETVYETDFTTNYNTTRNAWVTNYTDTLGTDPVTSFDPPTNAEMEARTLVAASYFDPAADTVANVTTTATTTDVTNGVSLAAGAITNASLAGNMEVVYETDFPTNYNATRNAWVTNYTDTLGTDPVTAFDPPTNAEMEARTLVAASYFDPAADTVANVTTVATLTGHTAQTADHTAGIADIPTVAEFNARTLVAASYFDPAADTVANVTTTANVTNQFGGRTDTGTFQTATHSATSMVLQSGEIAQDNQYKHWSIVVTSGNCAELSGRITDSVASTDTVTVAGFDDAGANCTPDSTLDGATYVLQSPTGLADDLATVSDTTSAIQVDASGYVKVSDGTGTGQIDTDSGTVLLRSATETQIDNIDTGTPNVAPDAAGGLVISDAGGLDVDGMNTNVSAILTDVELEADKRDTAMRCTVDNTNFAPTTTVIQCDLADMDDSAITPSVANKFTGLPICNKTNTDDVYRDCRYIITTAQGDTDTNEWKFTVDRAWTAAPDNASVFYIGR